MLKEKIVEAELRIDFGLRYLVGANDYKEIRCRTGR